MCLFRTFACLARFQYAPEKPSRPNASFATSSFLFFPFWPCRKRYNCGFIAPICYLIASEKSGNEAASLVRLLRHYSGELKVADVPGSISSRGRHHCFEGRYCFHALSSIRGSKPREQCVVVPAHVERLSGGQNSPQSSPAASPAVIVVLQCQVPVANNS